MSEQPEPQKLEAQCRYCHKWTFSLHKGQLEHNIKVHEMVCPTRKSEEEKQRREQKAK